jgi:hypothetical protein
MSKCQRWAATDANAPRRASAPAVGEEVEDDSVHEVGLHELEQVIRARYHGQLGIRNRPLNGRGVIGGQHVVVPDHHDGGRRDAGEIAQRVPGPLR